jgi:hypothetical protein
VYAGHWGFRQGVVQVRRYGMSYLQKRGPQENGQATEGAWVFNPKDLDRWPALLEFITSRAWPDGTLRQSGTLLLFADEGRLKVCLSDRDQGVVCFVTGDGVMGLLDAAEQLLRDGDGDWRPQRQGKKGR